MSVLLTSRLPRIATSLQVKVGAAITQGAQGIADSARMRVPVGDPDNHLRDAIHVEQTGPGEVSVVAGDKGAWYGHFVEFGTSRAAPHPFLIPAAEENADAVAALVNTALRSL